MAKKNKTGDKPKQPRKASEPASGSSSRQEIDARLQELRRVEISARNSSHLVRSDPNLTGLGYGLRMRDGKLTNELAVTFFVREKVKTDEEMYILGTRRLPTTLPDGTATDVVQFRPVAASDAIGQRGSKSYDPLVGGPQTSNADNHTAFWNWWGTIGTLCFDQASSAAMALSNYHVWVMNGGDSGDTIIQPGHPTAGDYAEAGAKLLLCGPILTHLIDWNAPSPLTIGLGAAAAAAWIAAAASDVIDPTRRGQIATPPTSATELTLRERVEANFDSVDDPIPGKPFRVHAKWKYQRQTNAAAYAHSVDEVQQNAHVILRKQLWTDLETYKGGQRVVLMAEIETARVTRPEDYHVLAQIVSPAEDQKLSVVLHPTICPEIERRRTCISLECDKIGSVYGGKYPCGVATFVAPANAMNRVVDQYPPGGDGHGELAIYDGHEILLPPAKSVEVEIVPISDPVQIEAYDTIKVVAKAKTTTAPLTSQVLSLNTSSTPIVRLVFATKGALLLKLCFYPWPRQDRSVGAVIAAVRGDVEHVRYFCYTGSITLDPSAALGCWKCYLYVQTVNNIAPGTDPAIAAQTIGGLPVAQNLTTQPAVNCAGCALTMLLDHAFHVI